MRSITFEDITSVDILCGKSKRCFNHTGNRRFRFLVSFNLDRYKEAKSRKEKSHVVESILRQIRHAGGRFLILNHDGTAVWAPEKVAKEKISHALRDKTPLARTEAAREQLRQSLAYDSSSASKDHHYLVANVKILSAEVPSDAHAADDRVEQILMNELELLSRQERLLYQSATLSTCPTSPSGFGRLSFGLPRQVSLPNVVGGESFTRKNPLSVQANFSSSYFESGRANNFNEYGHGGFGNEMSQPQSIPSGGKYGLVLSDGELSQRGFLDEGEDDIADWNLEEDLPHNFTEEDCENLVALLDYASSL